MMCQLDQMNDYEMETKILEKIFEQLSVERRVRAVVTERISSYICQLQKNYKRKLEDYQDELEDIRTECDLPVDASPFRFFSSDLEMTFTWQYITQYKEMLTELEDVDRFTERICCLILPNLYGLGVEEIRRMVYLRYVIPNLKGEEKLRKKKNNQRLKHLKIISKSRKNPTYKPMPKLPLKRNRLQH